MNSCIRCGIKLSHNYLKAKVMTINEKRKRVLVCIKCEEILDEKVKSPPEEHKIKQISEIKRRGDDEKAE